MIKMVWFSKQKVWGVSLVFFLVGAYLSGWFEILINLAYGRPVFTNDITLPQTMGSFFLFLAPWIWKLGSKFAKERSV